MSVNKILLPIDFPNSQPDVVQQAAFLARHFHSEILLLHVVAPLSYPAGLIESGHEITARDLHAEIIKRTQHELDQLLPVEFAGIAVRRLLLKGDPAREILKTAREENVDLIVISTHGHGVALPLFAGLGGSESVARQRLSGLDRRPSGSRRQRANLPSAMFFARWI